MDTILDLLKQRVEAKVEYHSGTRKLLHVNGMHATSHVGIHLLLNVHLLLEDVIKLAHGMRKSSFPLFLDPVTYGKRLKELCNKLVDEDHGLHFSLIKLNCSHGIIDFLN